MLSLTNKLTISVDQRAFVAGREGSNQSLRMDSNEEVQDRCSGRFTKLRALRVPTGRGSAERADIAVFQDTSPTGRRD